MPESFQLSPNFAFVKSTNFARDRRSITGIGSASIRAMHYGFPSFTGGAPGQQTCKTDFRLYPRIEVLETWNSNVNHYIAEYRRGPILSSGILLTINQIQLTPNYFQLASGKTAILQSTSETQDVYSVFNVPGSVLTVTRQGDEPADIDAWPALNEMRYFQSYIGQIYRLAAGINAYGELSTTNNQHRIMDDGSLASAQESFPAGGGRFAPASIGVQTQFNQLSGSFGQSVFGGLAPTFELQVLYGYRKFVNIGGPTALWVTHQIPGVPPSIVEVSCDVVSSIQVVTPPAVTLADFTGGSAVFPEENMEHNWERWAFPANSTPPANYPARSCSV